MRGEPEEEAAPETDAAETTGDEGKPGETHQKAKPKDLGELAKALGVEVKDLYSIAVPSSKEGESFTLGQLKDEMQKRSDFEMRSFQFEEERTRKESEFLRAQQEMQELISALPRTAIKPEVLEMVRQKHETVMHSERRKTLDVIPEWRDEEVRSQELAGIVEHLKGYGFPTNYLQGVYDHRSLKYIRDNWHREQRVRRALDSVKEVRKPIPGAKSKPAGAARKPGSTTVKPHTPEGRRAALASLLTGE